MRDAPPPESIEILAGEVRTELSAQRAHVESLDAKAGVLLGLAGLLVALAPSAASVWADGARFSSVVSAGYSLVALLPRNHMFVDLRVFRAATLVEEPASMRSAILDLHLEMIDETLFVIDHKSRRLRGSIATLVAGTMFAFVGLTTG